jgi:hypothetical protein
MWRFVVGWIVSDVWKDRNVFICRFKDCLGTAHLTQAWHLQQDCYGNPKPPYHNSYCLLPYCIDIYFYKCVSINYFYLFTYLYCEERRYCRHTYCVYVIFINNNVEASCRRHIFITSLSVYQILSTSCFHVDRQRKYKKPAILFYILRIYRHKLHSFFKDT